MAIESILLAITEQSRAEVAEILDRGKQRAQDIIADAEARAEREIERYVAEVSDKAERQATREVRAAHLQNGRRCSDIRLANYEELKAKTASRLEEIRDCVEYPEIFERLVRNIVFEAGEKPIVLIDPRDEELARKVFEVEDLKALKAELRPTLETLGGVVVCSSDERIYLDNRFESRLARLYDERSGDIWAVLDS